MKKLFQIIFLLKVIVDVGAATCVTAIFKIATIRISRNWEIKVMSIKKIKYYDALYRIKGRQLIVIIIIIKKTGIFLRRRKNAKHSRGITPKQTNPPKSVPPY